MNTMELAFEKAMFDQGQQELNTLCIESDVMSEEQALFEEGLTAHDGVPFEEDCTDTDLGYENSTYVKMSIAERILRKAGWIKDSDQVDDIVADPVRKVYVELWIARHTPIRVPVTRSAKQDILHC